MRYLVGGSGARLSSTAICPAATDRHREISFTDIEGSTRLWAEDRETMAEAVERHDTVVGSAINLRRPLRASSVVSALMELPDIHFATTSDDVSIAYWSIGSGPALLITHNFGWSHAEMEWTVPSMARFYTALAENHKLIRFDPRSTGMSDRKPGLDFTMTGMGLDISAVTDACGVDQITLLGVNTMGPPAIEYAARHPDQVNHLILCDTYAKYAGSAHEKWVDAFLAVQHIEEGAAAGLEEALYRELLPPDEVDAFIALVAAAESLDIGEANNLWDAQPLLTRVLAPTLVLVSRPGRVATLEEARSLATGIPTAQLKSIDTAMVPYFGAAEAVLAAISSFLGTAIGNVTAQGAGGFTTIVFTDLVSSTELVTRLGDVEGRSVFRWVEQTTAGLAGKHRGEVVKYTGDGAMVAFPSTSGALSFSLDLQEAMGESPIDLRIGMATGEPIAQDGDLHGAVVHQASRIADQGDAGEILVADAVRQLAIGKGFGFDPAGEITLKGFDEPTRLWKVTGSPGR